MKNKFSAFFAAYNESVKRGNPFTKEEVVSNFTLGRTSSVKELNMAELQLLVSRLQHTNECTRRDKMVKKIIAMAWEMGVLYREKKVTTQCGIIETTNYSRLDEWMTKNSYLKKKLSAYTYAELPKLVSQYQLVHQHWLNNNNNLNKNL